MINKWFILSLLSISLIACQNDKKAEGAADAENPELEKLKEENEKLKTDLATRDESMNESIRLFNEIEDNLSAIRQKEKVINLSRNNDPEYRQDQKERIVEEIQLINSLLEENKNKVNLLRSKLSKADVKVGEMDKMIESLVKKVEEQEALIVELRDELAKYDIAMAELTATLNETMAVVEEKDAELNKAWFVFGTTKELKEQGVVTKEGGFIGLGKIVKMREDFNQEYFTQIDITKTKEIPLGAKKVKILTTHPAGTYKLVTSADDKVEKMQILNPEKFWSVSKYLCMIVE
jgi:predicted  nucleic acid-binding Zn-ribbon protein